MYLAAFLRKFLESRPYLTLGNLAALWQDDVRRLIGWSSVSQSGYALMAVCVVGLSTSARSEEHTSELQSLMRISYAVFCLKKKKEKEDNTTRPNKPQITLQQQ